VRVLEDWRPPFPGCHLHYRAAGILRPPSRRWWMHHTIEAKASLQRSAGDPGHQIVEGQRIARVTGGRMQEGLAESAQE
jgi:hypothetical protein